jgi:hypothetical protein
MLLLPMLMGKSSLPPREQSYATQGWETGTYPWIQHVIFEEQGDIDIVFIGSSHISVCMDARRLQDQLSKQLGRPAVVRVLAWGGAGFDALYFTTRDLLEHRKVHMLVFYGDNNGNYRNPKSSMWFRWAENARDLTGLSLSEQAYYYFASLVGLPRNLLSRFRSNLPTDLHSPNIVDALGSVSPQKGFGKGDVNNAVFVPFTPLTPAEPADVCVYSPETKTNFLFAAQPLPIWQIHFARKFAALAESKGCCLVLLNIPILEEVRSSQIIEQAFWPDVLSANLTMVGIPPAKMFASLSDDDIHKLYYDLYHFSKNGQGYFTSLIMPTLLKLYEIHTDH